MRNRLLLLPLAVSLAASAWLAPSAARACSCIPPDSPQKSVEKAAIVFEGRASAPISDGSQLRYTFEVARMFKGPGHTNVEITTANTSAACGRKYSPGEPYIVYAHGAEGNYRDTLCSRSRRSVDAAEDFEALGGGVVQEPTADPDEPTAEPPRIEEPATEPPPVARKSGGCRAGGPAPASALLVMLGLASLRRRTRSRVGSSAQPRR